MFEADEVDSHQGEFGGPDLDVLRALVAAIDAVLIDATLDKPGSDWMASGGKAGRHTEHLGYMIAEMQYLQRSHPGASGNGRLQPGRDPALARQVPDPEIPVLSITDLGIVRDVEIGERVTGRAVADLLGMPGHRGDREERAGCPAGSRHR